MMDLPTAADYAYAAADGARRHAEGLQRQIDQLRGEIDKLRALHSLPTLDEEARGLKTQQDAALAEARERGEQQMAEYAATGGYGHEFLATLDLVGLAHPTGCLCEACRNPD